MARRRDLRLNELIESVSVDSDSESDVAMGLCYAMQEHVSFPFVGTVIGEEVIVEGVEEGEGAEVVALCKRKGRKYHLRLDDVHIENPPKGSEWIDAYRQFRGR